LIVSAHFHIPDTLDVWFCAGKHLPRHFYGLLAGQISQSSALMGQPASAQSIKRPADLKSDFSFKTI
jgi:hypothetical protein